MGTSNRPASHPQDTVPEEVQFVLDWNPPQLIPAPEVNSIWLSQEPSDTARSGSPTISIGCTRQAAFYNMHLASHLVLERVVHLDTLVCAMARTVDQAIQDAATRHFLPKNSDFLHSAKQIERRVETHWSPRASHKSGVAETYFQHTVQYCCPVASTLAIHPSSQEWSSILVWSRDPTVGGWAIADGALRISISVTKNGGLAQQLVQSEDDGKKDIIERLARHETPLAIWEMKNLAVGTAQVMEEIVKRGQTHAKFPWKKCTTGICSHHRKEVITESKGGYDAGFDALSQPWTLPSTSAADSQPTSSSFSEDGESMRGKRRRSGSDPSDDKRPPKKSKADLMDEKDESYDLLPGARKDANGDSFLQQTWAEAVRNNCTIMVLHSGNHEIIGIRHRKTQTLYISHVIEPHSCSNPAYGKIQVGIYIAAIQETIDRVRQHMEAREKRVRADTSLENEANEANPDRDHGDHFPGRPTGSNKRGESTDLSRRQDKYEGNGKCHANGKVDNQALLVSAARQNHLCLRFLYDIYDSPCPASFRRVHDEPKEATGPSPSPTLPFPPGCETTPPSDSSIHITAHSELQPGSTGIVHIGTMAVDPSGPTAKVAVKLAFSKDEKSRLTEEHRVYSHLHSKGVEGIPHDIGLFVDEEPLLDNEGPHALIITYAGISLCHRSSLASDSVKDSLLATLRSIHRADILHDDIRLANLCVTLSGEAFIVDFSHATESRSRKEKAREIRELSYILGMDSPTKPAAKAVEKPVLTSQSG